MQISVTQFRSTCFGAIEKVQKEGSRITITRHGKPAAELIPISASSPGKLFGRSKDSTRILGDLLSTEEQWNAEA
jgi:prevent-host-death family protein